MHNMGSTSAAIYACSLRGLFSLLSALDDAMFCLGPACSFARELRLADKSARPTGGNHVLGLFCRVPLCRFFLGSRVARMPFPSHAFAALAKAAIFSTRILRRSWVAVGGLSRIHYVLLPNSRSRTFFPCLIESVRINSTRFIFACGHVWSCAGCRRRPPQDGACRIASDCRSGIDGNLDSRLVPDEWKRATSGLFSDSICVRQRGKSRVYHSRFTCNGLTFILQRAPHPIFVTKKAMT